MKNQNLLNLIKNKGILLIFLCILFACKKAEYDKLVIDEMAKNIEYDSLFLGMTFGQTKQEFFDKCWKLNSQELVSHGHNNQFVGYDLPLKEGDSLTKSIRMLFYGVFNEDTRMTGMNLKFSYNAWSLWNKSKQSDRLLPIVQDTLKKWFPGNDFIKIKIENEDNELWVKVDGNRRIVIKPLDDSRYLEARIDDLRYILDK